MRIHQFTQELGQGTGTVVLIAEAGDILSDAQAAAFIGERFDKSGGCFGSVRGVVTAARMDGDRIVLAVRVDEGHE